MPDSTAAAPVVFVGPSLAPDAVAAAIPHGRVEPPIVRGDLARLQADGASTFLILDGSFLHRLAVAPSEIVDAIAAGARVLGAASIGAIRAAECWPAGMEGIGGVYRLYRLGVLRDDDEVAVATDPERDFAAISVALVNVRYAVLASLRAGVLDRARARAVLGAARQLHFAERRWESILGLAGVGDGGAIRALCEQIDVKRRDAVAAVGALRALGSSPGAGASNGRVGSRRTPGGVEACRPRPRPDRYPGHDPLLGHSLPELRRVLASWLLDSGRYGRYFGEAPPDLGDLADVAGFEANVWTKLEAEGALEHELMRWFAVRRLSA